MVSDVWIRIDQAASYMGVSKETIRNWIKKTDIPALAKFICEDPNRDKMITDTADNAVISTFGCFLDRVDKETIDFPALLNELQKIQLEGSLGYEEVEDDYEMD